MRESVCQTSATGGVSLTAEPVLFRLSHAAAIRELLPYRAGVKCPPFSNGHVLECAFECCPSFEGADQGYYCCGPEERALIDNGVEHGRAERFVAYGRSTTPF
ncbi:hypothetical protein ANCDUO_12896 [Ancylostoma duodenale]|uniref:Uncharacterized protein n=1 Tax=Ancylostoma duodenale TaxID=51022 RepID=A0A0C2GIM3_9BILA|nr:hypothetical protein ANCDUO_12896 [Ancylostoma duodenale]